MFPLKLQLKIEACLTVGLLFKTCWIVKLKLKLTIQIDDLTLTPSYDFHLPFSGLLKGLFTFCKVKQNKTDFTKK